MTTDEQILTYFLSDIIWGILLGIVLAFVLTVYKRSQRKSK